MRNPWIPSKPSGRRTCGPTGTTARREGSQGGPAPVGGGRRFGPRRGAAGAADRSEAYYRKVADQLIEQIEAGTARWTQA